MTKIVQASKEPMEDTAFASFKNKIASSFFWNFLEKLGGQGIALIVQIVLARLLSPSDFGTMAILVVFVNIGNVFVQSGLNTALIQTEHLDPKDPDSAFWVSFSISLVTYFVLFLVAPYIASFYNSSILEPSLRVLGIMLIFNSVYSIQSALATRELAFKKIFYATLVAMILSGTIGIGISLAGGGIWGLVSQQVLYSFIAALILTVQMRWHPKLTFSAQRAKKLFSFGWKLLASGLLETIYQSLADLIVGKQFSASSLGYFNQGKKYPQVLATVLDSTIQPIMLAAVSKVQSNKNDVKGIVRRALKTSTFLIMPIMAYLAVAAEPIIILILGEQWIPAAPYFQVFCIVCALLPIHTTNLQALNGMGRSDLYLKLEIIKKSYGLVILLFTAFFLKSILAISIGYIATGIISAFVNAAPNKTVIGYSYAEQIIDIFPIIALTFTVSIVGLIIGSFTTDNAFLRALIQLIIMSSLYLSAARIMKIDAFMFLWGEIKNRLP